MKGIKKYFLVFAALAAALAFVSCSDEDDSTVAVYKASEDGVTVEVTFSDDNTWEAVYSAPGYSSETAMKGTYTGDPSKDDTITITMTHILNDKGTALESVGEPWSEKITISGGKFKFAGADYTRQ